MTETQQIDGEQAIGEQINGFADLYPRQTGFANYTVLSLRNGSPTAHRVDLVDLTCPCEDAQYNKTTSGEICDHLAVALYQHSGSLDWSDHAAHDLAQIVSDARESADKLRESKDLARTIQSTSAAAAADDDASTTTDDADDADETQADDDADDDGQVVEVDPADTQAGLVANLESWFDDVAETLQFDADIIDVSWARADGVDGAIVEREPFSGDYYDDGDWQDKETFDSHKETVGDSILSPRDEFEWFGEPDYQYFVAEEDIAEVVGND